MKIVEYRKQKRWKSATPVDQLCVCPWAKREPGNERKRRLEVVVVKTLNAYWRHVEDSPEVAGMRFRITNQFVQPFAACNNKSQARARRQLAQLIPQVSGQLATSEWFVKAIPEHQDFDALILQLVEDLCQLLVRITLDCAGSLRTGDLPSRGPPQADLATPT